MKAAFVLAAVAAAVGVYAQHPSAQPWTSCMTTCMDGAVSAAGCGSTWNSTECLCLNPTWISRARTCMYAPCASEVYRFYTLREAECGTLTADLNNPEFFASNGNSTWDRANPNGNQTISSILAAASGAASGASGSSGAARPTGAAAASASSGSATGPSRSSSAGGASASAASATPTSAAGHSASFGSKEGAVAVVAAFGVVAGSYLVL